MEDHLVDPLVTLNIWLCLLGFLTPQWFSRHSSTMCSGTWSTGLFLFTSMTSWSSPRKGATMSNMSGKCYSCCLRIVCPLSWSVSFHARSIPFLGFVLMPEVIWMDPAKLKAVADFPTPGSSRVHQFFTGDSFGILVKFPLMRETAAIVLYHVFFAFMSSLWMWSLTGVPSLHLSFGKNSVNMWGANASLSSGYHSQTNGQAEKANQDFRNGGVLCGVSRTINLEIQINNDWVCTQLTPGLVYRIITFVHGGSTEKPFLGLARGTKRWQTVTVLSPHFMCVARRFGCQPRTFPLNFLQINWGPNL